MEYNLVIYRNIYRQYNKVYKESLPYVTKLTTALFHRFISC